MTAYAGFTQNFTACQQNNCNQLIITDSSTGFGAGVGELLYDVAPKSVAMKKDIETEKSNKFKFTRIYLLLVLI